MAIAAATLTSTTTVPKGLAVVGGKAWVTASSTDECGLALLRGFLSQFQDGFDLPLHLLGIDTTVAEGEGSVIQMGTSASPLTSAADETMLLTSYFNSTGKNAYGMRMLVTKTSVSAGAPRVLTLRAILGHTTGHGPQGANAVDARATLDKTGNTGISGEMHAMESQCRVEDASRTVQGTYAAHKFTNNFQTGNTMPAATTFFLRFVDEGAVKTPLMFDFDSMTAGSSNCIVADTGAVDGIATTHYLRVKDPDGNTGYIAIFGAMS